MTSETAGSLNTSYGFDPSGNLSGIPGGAAGTYDHAGELTSSTLSGTTTNYAYNADGERTGATQSGNTIASATWNGAGQLTAYSNSSGNMTSATYDGDGLRVSSATASGTQNYVWNTLPTVPQLTMDSANAYIYGTTTAPNEQVSLSTGAVTYLVTDSLGSVRGTVNSAGALTASSTYDAWGNPLTSGGLTATTPFGYAGSYTDTTGLLYLINRYYDPATGQFLSVDPMLTETQQAYEYANGNSVIYSDASGQFWLFDFYHWSGHIAFGFTANQAREMAQGYIWGAAGVIGAWCSWALGGIGVFICLGVVGFIAGTLSQAASGWRYFDYRVVEFAYGWHWTWWGGYPYFYHSSTWGW